MTRFTVTCPHCHAALEIDEAQQLVTACKVPEKARSTTSMEERLQALAAEKEAASAKLAEAFRVEKAGETLREEKFKKLLEEAGKQPITKPIRDIDID